MRHNIRGNFGTQILQAALAVARDPGEPILCVNTGNLPYDGGNKLPLVFKPACRVIEVDTMMKTPYWIPGAAKEIFENREKIFRWLVPLPIPQIVGFNAVHIRGKDKRMCSDDSYRELIEMGENGDDRMLIFTDDEEYVKTLTDRWENIYSESMIEDWHCIYNAPTTWAAPSSFILSMLLFNPEKKITFLGDKYWTGDYDLSGDKIFLEELLPYCPNVTIC